MRIKSPNSTGNFRIQQVGLLKPIYAWLGNSLTFNSLGRAGSDADMAATALFLAGPGGLFYNSAILIPDGGE